MTCRQVSANGLAYRFCPDQPPRAGDRLWSLFGARVLDEITQEPPLAEITVSTETEGLYPRVASDGLAGLVGNPARRFPGLDVNPVDIDWRVAVDGYLPHAESVIVPPQGAVGFPDGFQTTWLPDVLLHREAVVLRGRVMGVVGGVRQALAGASLMVTGVWNVFPPASAAVPADPPNLVSLSPGLYGGYVAGLAVARRRDLVLTVGEDKRLLAPVTAEATTVRLSDRVNLAPGQVLVLDTDDPARTEYLPITAIDGAGTGDQPATLTLAHPCLFDHPQGVTAVRATPQAPGADNNLARDTVRGDQCLFLDGLAGLAEGVIVEVTAGGQPSYHRISLFAANSGVDGYYRLPPLARVAQFGLRVQHAAFMNPLDLVISPDYGLRENRIDLEFP